MVVYSHIGCRHRVCISRRVPSCQDHKLYNTRHTQVRCKYKSVSAPQVETQKDHSLRRRIQSLQCFLFEQLHKELNQAQSQPQPNPAQAPAKATNSSLPTTNEPATSVSQAAPPAVPPSQSTPAAAVGAATAAGAAVPGAPSDQRVGFLLAQGFTNPPDTSAATNLVATATAALEAAATASDIAAATAPGAAGADEAGVGQQQPGGEKALHGAAVEGTSRKTVIDGTFGIVVKQRTKVLTGVQADKFRESRSFQVHTAFRSSSTHTCLFVCYTCIC